MKLYTASKTKHFQKWLDLRSQGFPIISTWIDEAGPGASNDYADLATRCITEVTQSDFVVVYCEPDEILKGALIEIGAALATNVNILATGPTKNISPVFVKHRLWHQFDSLDDIISLLNKTDSKTVALILAERHSK